MFEDSGMRELKKATRDLDERRKGERRNGEGSKGEERKGEEVES